MARFLITSLILTIALNLALRLIPGLPQRIGRWLESVSGPSPPTEPGAAPTGPRVRVIVPWKAMLIGSVALTVIVNLITLLR